MMRGHGSRAQAVRRRLTRARVLVPVLVAATLLAAMPATESAFTANTDATASLTSAASFKTYPQAVTGDAAQFYHRTDEAPSAEATSVAADASGNNKPGTYAGATDGPSTYWPLDDGSGTLADDAAGAANPGTLVGGPTWASGSSALRGGGVTLNGTSQYVRSAGPAVDTSASYTVAAWVNLSSLPTGFGATVLSQEAGFLSAFYLQYVAGTKSWSFNSWSADTGGGVKTEAAAPAPSPVGRWTHLAGVYDDATDVLRLYVDGTLAATAACTLDFATTGSLVTGSGRWDAGPSDYLAGTVDDVRAYRRALTGPEVAELLRPGTWWDFEAVNTNVADVSGSGNAAVAAGTSFGAGGVNLDGTSQHVAGSKPAVHTDRSFTVAAWARLTNTTGTRIVASQVGTNTNAFTLGSNGTNWQFVLTGSDVAAPATVAATGTTAVTTTLTHLAGVYSAGAGEMRLYVNGRLERTIARAAAGWDATGVLYGGRSRTNSSTFGGYLAGTISDLRVYDRPLSTDDVLDQYLTPLARYDMEDFGTTLSDGTGNGNTATRVGAATWVPSSHRQRAMSLNGTNQYATTAGPVLDTATSYSVSAWVYLTSAGVGNRTVVSQDGTSPSAFFLQHYGADSMNHWTFQQMPADVSSGGNMVSSISTAVLNRWTHLVATYDDPNNAIKLYVNGALQGTVTASSDFASTGATVIGAGKYAGARGDEFPGSLDEVALYQKVLTAADVTALYERSPILRYDLNEAAGTTAGDRSGGNNSATVSSAGWATGYSGGSSLSFNGGAQSAATGTSPVITNDSFSVAAFVNMNAKTTQRYAVSQNGTNVYGFALGFDNTADRWSFKMQASDSTASAQSSANGLTAVVLDTWVHLVGVYDDPNDQLRLYVNGKLEGTAAYATDWSATGTFALGYARWSGAATYRWSGRVDDVWAFDRAVTAEEARGLYGSYDVVPAPLTVHLPALTAGVPGALQGAQQGQSASTAVAFAGTGILSNNQSYVNPGATTVDGWFRAAPGAGGALAGFATTATAMTGTADRVLYLDADGQVSFGVSPGGVKTTVRSPLAYTDGAWHHVAASYGAAGVKLYVDGALVASSTGATSALNATGYWRFGGVSLAGGWPNRPASDLLTGTLDEPATYPSQLTDQQVARHRAGNH